MFRFPRAGATAVVAAAMTLTSAAPGAAQVDQSAEVLDVTLPVSELVLETSSLDRSYRRVESAEDVRLTLAADVLFAFDRANLSPRARDRLADAADEIRSLDPDAVAIVGHTDSKGSDAYNSGLSKRRAQAVQDALAGSLGGDAPALEATGKGEDEPIASNTTADGEDSPMGRARNRRVEIRIPKR